MFHLKITDLASFSKLTLILCHCVTYMMCYPLLQRSTTGVSNSSCSEGQMWTYKETQGPHYDADATVAVPEPYEKQLLHLISCERYREV